MVIFAECIKSRRDGWGAKRLVFGPESRLSQTDACSSALPRGASEILAREGKGHSSERMISFSPEAAPFRTAATQPQTLNAAAPRNQWFSRPERCFYAV